MADLLNFAQGVGQIKPLSQLGAGVSNIVQQKKQQELQQQALQQQAEQQAATRRSNSFTGGSGGMPQWQYEELQQQAIADKEKLSIARQNFSASQTRETLNALQDALPEDAQLTSQQYYEDLNEIQQNSFINDNINIIAAVTSGNREWLKEQTDAKISGYAETDEDMASNYAEIQKAVDAGDNDKALSIMAVLMSATEETRDAYGTLLTLKKAKQDETQMNLNIEAGERAETQLGINIDENERDALSAEMEIKKSIDEITFPTQEAKDQYVADMEKGNYSDEMINKIAATARVIAGSAGMTREEIADSKYINDKYVSLTSEYRDVHQAYVNVVSDAKRGNDLALGAKVGADGKIIDADKRKAVGVADLALVTSSTQLIDPGQGVRQQDVENAKDTGSFTDNIITGLQAVADGRALSVAQRNEFIKLAERRLENAGTILDDAELQLGRLANSFGVDTSVIFMPRDQLTEKEKPIVKKAKPNLVPIQEDPIGAIMKKSFSGGTSTPGFSGYTKGESLFK